MNPVTITLKLQLQLESYYNNRAHLGAYKAGAIARLQGRTQLANPYAERDGAQARGFWSAWLHGWNEAGDLADTPVAAAAAASARSAASSDRRLVPGAVSSGRSRR